jgi:hydroxyacylglutathione hydrolase
VKVFASAEGGADWQYEWLKGGGHDHQLVRDGDTFSIGNIGFCVMHTPGHTPEHVAYLVTDSGGGADRPMGAFTGDFLFVGDVGRPDLLETAAGVVGAMEPSARELYRTIVRFREFPDDLQVWPAHGAGSACGKALGAVPMSTLGYEKSFNVSLRAAAGEDAFVSWILDGQPEPPLYFARMKQQNRGGPAVLGAFPRPRLMRQAKFEELDGAIGVAVLDTRPWPEYRAGHLPGALYAPLNTAFNTIVGCYVPDGMAIYLIIEESRLHEAIIDLIHIGLDHIVGYATPEMFADHAGSGGKVAKIREMSVSELDEHIDNGSVILDVRGAAEIATTGRISGARNIAWTRLLERIEDLPSKNPVAVYCETGSRAAYASGLLDRMGYPVTSIVDGVVEWKAAGGAVSP